MGSFSKQKQKIGIKQPPTLTKGQLELLNKLTGTLTGELGAGVQAYPGQITPGPSGIQEQAFAGISDILAGDGMLGEGMGALSDILKPYDPALAMQAWEKGVKEPSMRMWTEEMIPQIMESFAGKNALSSSGALKTLSKSGTDLASTISGQLAQTLLGEKGKWTEAQLTGIPFTQMPLQELLAGLGAGGTERGITAEQLGEPYQKWAYERPYANPWLAQMPLALGTRAFENIPYSKETLGGSGGVSCCFIFAEGDSLTNAVREIRDELFPPDSYVAKGYKRMAKWLVPMMKKSKIVKNIVKFFMTKPIAKFCESKNLALIPICVGWCLVWELYGRV